MFEYKVIAVHLPVFKSNDVGAEKIQKEMKIHAKDGWRVHNVVSTDISLVMITFEKEI
jgi:hypothetical protein